MNSDPVSSSQNAIALIFRKMPSRLFPPRCDRIHLHQSAIAFILPKA
ncbi:hypothetical protein NDI44_08815 [Trichocoleus sp. DQ-A3]|nr:hypothetical protein [Coleofasciculus sp. FACHB-125]MBD1899293.1 hypothetical protein [Coleofasciculus sp. FACHB-125]